MTLGLHACRLVWYQTTTLSLGLAQLVESKSVVILTLPLLRFSYIWLIWPNCHPVTRTQFNLGTPKA